MNEVWIYHAGLDRYTRVPESAVHQLSLSGWVQQDPPPEPAEEEAEPEPATSASTRRRRAQPTSTEGDEE